MEGELDRMCDEANRDWRRARVVADAVMLPTGVRSVAYANSHETADSNTARGNAHAAVAHAAVAHASAWPEPYDPAGDADANAGSLNAGLDRLGNHHPGEGGFGRVDTAQRVDRARRDVPADGREPVRDSDREAAVRVRELASAEPDRPREAAAREAADALIREAQERGEYDIPSIFPVEPGAIVFGPVTPHRECDRTIRVSRTREPESFPAMDPVPMSSVPGLIEQIRKERDEAREALRVRDARVEPPPPGSTVLVWDGQAWMPDDADWPIRYARTGVHSRFWLPMPPAPEEKQ